MASKSERIPTGIPGLDAITQGGFPESSVNLIAGPAGSGKTLLASQFFFNGAKEFRQKGLYLVLEENRQNVARAMKDLSMDVSPYEEGGELFIIDLGEVRGKEGKQKGTVGFQDIKDFLDSCLKATGAERLVIDSLSTIGLYYRSIEDLREELFIFSRFLRQKDVTSLLLTESIEGGPLTRFGVEQFVADSFIVLGLEEVRGELRRTITVRKMRFTKHDTAKHPFLITSRGIEISSGEKAV